MAYGVFADVYDLFNEDADYAALHEQITARLRRYGVTDGIVADLGCGTGDLTLMLAQDGYDMIGVDASSEMLSVLRQKAEENGQNGLLLLCQDLTQLDLYGTVRAALSTFDTFNHIGPLASFRRALGLAALFTEPGGVVIFDMNTPYKHETVLGDRTFELESDDVRCIWRNRYDADARRTEIALSFREADGTRIGTETFYEYCYTLSEIREACDDAGLDVVEVCDGEHFGPLSEHSERYLVTALRRSAGKGTGKTDG